MPIRKTLFVENHYYHVYNRGVENRIIFQDETDYKNFQDILAYYLQTTDKAPEGAMSRTGLANVGLFEKEIHLIAYCLTPHYFHLLLHQQTKDAVSRFMSRVGTAYSMNFNQRYHRIGSLFQGRFRAKHIDTFDYLLESTKYLHLFPHAEDAKLPIPELAGYKYSSYKKFLKKEKPETPLTHALDEIVKPEEVLQHCYTAHPGITYQSFVEAQEYPNWFPPLLKWIK